MSEGWGLASALTAGVLLGAIFFGGLWWTVRRGVSSRWVPLWFSVSMLLRTSIVLIGFHAVAGDDWRRFLAAMLGFIIARLIVMRLVEPAQKPRRLARKASHAP